MKLTIFAASIALALSTSTYSSVQANAQANTQEWPARTIRLVVPYAAGGSTDIIARVVAERLSAPLGRSVIIENIGGANGNIGAGAIARDTADGYSFLFTPPGPIAINAALYASMPYGPDAFAPVANVATIPNVLAVHPSVPAQSIKEFIALLKAQPGKLNYGTGGVGSTPHLTVAMFLQTIDAQAQHVPYKGSAPMLQDLVGGSIQFTIDNLPSAMSLIKAGELRALAVSSAARSPFVPELPTIQEAGLPGFEAISWFCIVAPKNTPAAIVRRMNSAINDVLRMPDVAERLASFGATPAGGTAEDLGRLIASERVKWKDVAERSGARLN
jgi:tripartite-type tricarboxylate transporter receptor subunit TctC